MVDFYDLIDAYASLHDMNKSAVLNLWYRGVIDAVSLLEADLVDEGIFGYTDHLVSVLRVLHDRSKKDHGVDPWALHGD